ncbi:hypothetical protein GIB67_023939 [Kingdonia uniflora]|uniref:Heavy metal transport/detoxification superfamily protein n=1 Tax=Kingdonia uniflora TaxID=39325 RepID=A0A7J7M6K5_9MAGN|nr:hypothetical protein GIB67_023939 [Kingdonia uniflora]
MILVVVDKGVEEVHGDVETNKLTIKSKVDPWKLHERLQKKTSKKVELVSPLPKKDKDDNNKKPKPDEKKPKENGFTGVQTLTLDTEKDLVTVKGAIDPEHLVKYLKYKLNKSVEIVPHKKDGNSNNNNPGGGGNKKGNNEEKISTGGGDGRGGLFAQFDMTKMDYYGNQYGQLYGSTFPYVHAPQIFSDENPNACLIM